MTCPICRQRTAATPDKDGWIRCEHCKQEFRVVKKEKRK